MLIPLGQVLQISEICSCEICRKWSSQISVDCDRIVESSQFGEVHRNRINFEAVGYLFQEWCIDQYHFVIVIELLSNVPLPLNILIRTFLNE